MLQALLRTVKVWWQKVSWNAKTHAPQDVSSVEPVNSSLDLSKYHFEGLLTVQRIEHDLRASLFNFLEVEAVFISIDLYELFYMHIMTDYGYARYTYLDSLQGQKYLKLRLTGGDVEIIPVHGMKNFYMLGKKGDYDKLIRATIDREFESAFLSS